MTDLAVGTGKTDTINVLTNHSEYIWTSSSYGDTIWYWINQQRNNKLNDCDDWFLPSIKDLNLMADVGTSSRDTIYNGTFWTTTQTTQSNEDAWNMTRDTVWARTGKSAARSVVAIRAF